MQRCNMWILKISGKYSAVIELYLSIQKWAIRGWHGGVLSVAVYGTLNCIK